MPASDLPPWLDPSPQPPCAGARGQRPGLKCPMCKGRHRKTQPDLWFDRRIDLWWLARFQEPKPEELGRLERTG